MQKKKKKNETKQISFHFFFKKKIELNFNVKGGSNVLVMGEPGCGKSTLIRILNGIWPFFNGIIGKPMNDPKQMFYLPQKPYLFFGKLVDQIKYPDSEEEVDEKLISKKNQTHTTNTLRRANDNIEMLRLLKMVGVRSLLGVNLESEKFEDWFGQYTNSGGVDLVRTNEDEIYRKLFESKFHWLDILSPGEQQLISFARLFFHKPKFAILDEATSYLSESCEEKLYKMCIDFNITLLSIGHRSSLIKFHQNLLLFSENKWQFTKIK